jgi:hypothetical protein
MDEQQPQPAPTIDAWARAFPSAVQARAALRRLGVIDANLSGSGGDYVGEHEGAYLAGILHAVATMWVAESMTDRPGGGDFVVGYADTFRRQVPHVLASMAVQCRTISTSADSMKALGDHVLTATTIAAAAADVACWALASAGELCKHGDEFDDARCRATSETMTRKVKVMQDQLAMLSDLLRLQADADGGGEAR